MRNEDLYSGVWSKPAFEALSLEASLLWLWTWTNPKCGVSGLYDVGRRSMSESKLSEGALDHALEELSCCDDDYFTVQYEEGVMFVVSRLERWTTRTPPVLRSIVKDVNSIKTGHPLRTAWADHYLYRPWPKPESSRSLAAAIDSLGLTLNGVSLESQTSASGREGSTLTRDSVESQGKGKGKGKGTTSKGSAQGGGKVDARARSRVADPDLIPDSTPTALVEVVRPVLGVLARCQADRGGNVPTIRGVGLDLAAFPDRDHVAVAQELEHWATAGNGSSRDIKDWTGIYRTFLRRSPAATPSRPASSSRPRSTYDHLIQRS